MGHLGEARADLAIGTRYQLRPIPVEQPDRGGALALGGGKSQIVGGSDSHGVIWNCPCAEKKDHFVLRQLQVQPPQPFRGPRLRTARIDDEVGLECACRSVVARENLHARTVALRLSGGAQR